VSDRDPLKFGDADDNLRAFRRDLFGGSLRWPTTDFAILSLAFIVMRLASPGGIQTYVPVRLSGTPLLVVTAAIALIWMALALVNWRNHNQR
jgi:hypothetical protein